MCLLETSSAILQKIETTKQVLYSTKFSILPTFIHCPTLYTAKFFMLTSSILSSSLCCQVLHTFTFFILTSPLYCMCAKQVLLIPHKTKLENKFFLCQILPTYKFYTANFYTYECFQVFIT